MSNFSIEVEVLAGTSIEEAITEAKDLAQRMNLAFVMFNLNGVRMSISCEADVDELAEDYRYALSREINMWLDNQN